MTPSPPHARHAPPGHAHTDPAVPTGGPLSSPGIHTRALGRSPEPDVAAGAFHGAVRVGAGPRGRLQGLREWLMPRRGRSPTPVALTQRRIFLLPTRHGLLFAGVLVVMLVGSVNYALNLGYGLTFLLGAMAATSVLHAFRTLVGLSVDVRATGPVFAGEAATFEIRLSAPPGATRRSVGVVAAGGSAALADCPGGGAGVIHLQVPAPRRGHLWPGRLTVFTRYPLGLVYAWSTVEPDRTALVYPRPEDPPAPLPAADEGEGARERRSGGDDDFSGLRPWRAGESTHRIAWKAVARGSPLLTKQFEGETGHDLWLDWHALPATLPPERRLSRLARWAVDAEAGARTFGIRLPGVEIEPSSGRAHRDRVLAALALAEVT